MTLLGKFLGWFRASIGFRVKDLAWKVPRLV